MYYSCRWIKIWTENDERLFITIWNTYKLHVQKTSNAQFSIKIIIFVQIISILLHLYKYYIIIIRVIINKKASSIRIYIYVWISKIVLDVKIANS